MLQREIADPLERNSVPIFSILEHLQANFCCNLITFLNIGGINQTKCIECLSSKDFNRVTSCRNLTILLLALWILYTFNTELVQDPNNKKCAL